MFDPPGVKRLNMLERKFSLARPSFQSSQSSNKSRLANPKPSPMSPKSNSCCKPSVSSPERAVLWVTAALTHSHLLQCDRRPSTNSVTCWRENQVLIHFFQTCIYILGFREDTESRSSLKSAVMTGVQSLRPPQSCCLLPEGSPIQ